MYVRIIICMYDACMYMCMYSCMYAYMYVYMSVAIGHLDAIYQRQTFDEDVMNLLASFSSSIPFTLRAFVAGIIRIHEFFQSEGY